jgi:hypothetical protein
MKKILFIILSITFWFVFNTSFKQLSNYFGVDRGVASNPGNKQITVVNANKNTELKTANSSSILTASSSNSALPKVDPQLLPHELENSAEIRMARENQFYEAQRAELEMFENLLATMQEIQAPESEIASIKQQIALIESARFEDTVQNEGNEFAENLTEAEKRSEFLESLRQQQDLSDEVREVMANMMFPDEQTLPSSETASAIKMPHEIAD